MKKVGKLSVVSVRGGARCDVYIGRATGRHKESVLANHFVIGKHGDRATVIQSYKAWLLSSVKGKNELVCGELNRIWRILVQGKDVTLGCWCCPDACHGDVIVALISSKLKKD